MIIHLNDGTCRVVSPENVKLLGDDTIYLPGTKELFFAYQIENVESV